MASKHPTNISDNARGSSKPNPISPFNKLLSSIISLPTNPTIVYAIYAPTSGQDDPPEDIIEVARRQLVVRNRSGQFSILDSLLPAPRLHREDKCLLIFGITSHDHLDISRERINALQFTSLSSSETFSFTPQELYPCSFACASEREPCPTCLSQDPSLKSDTLSTSIHLPRIPLRKIYATFLNAVRDRLIDDIVEASLTSESANGRHVKKFRNGFLLGPVNDFTSSEWGANWEHHVKNRPLIHCHLLIHLTQTRLVIHPILHPTPYLPLLLSSPLVSGMPISLLPYGVPAYYLTTYTGPTSALTAEFEASLSGLGVGPWKAPPQIYIIAWISIQNEQGEEKGMNIIWPLSLCLAYHPASSHLRKSLAYVPPIPTQLQPSPPPLLPPAITFASSNAQQSLSSSRPGLPRRACTSIGIDSFRSLTLGRTKDMNSVAIEIGGYVDAVAKDREKERERIRREREAGSSPKLQTTSAGPSRTTSPMKPSATMMEQITNMAPLTLRDAIPLDSDITMEQSYPSPAQTIPSSHASVNTKMGRTSPEPSSSLVSLQPELEPLLVQPPSTSPPSGPTEVQAYDPFGNPDSTWSQPPRDFMDMDMDMDMDYNMGFGMPIDPSGSGGGAADRMTMDDFEDGLTFTDDDFSFFDKPTTGTSRAASGTVIAPVSAMSHSGVESGLTPAAGPAPFGLSPPFYGDIGSGPGPPSGTPGHPGSSPWVPSALGEAFTPRFDGPSSDLMAHSPDKTTSSHSAPATPTVQLSPSSDHLGRISRPHHRPSIFDPIPFAVSHRISDGKYVSGKFSLPSPPDEEDRTSGWKIKYSAATDPRIGVVRKLMSVKKSFDQGSRDSKMSPSWIREHDEWQRSPSDEANGDKSEDSDDDDIELDDSPMVSRPSTPSPTYLPAGPTLLHMQFRHSELLRISIPLRPPGVAVAHTPTASATAAASIPTPASPAAAENSKSLEAAAYILAKEAVENNVWARAWYLAHSARYASEVWQADVKTIIQLLENVQLLQGPLDIRSLFELEPDSPEGSLELLAPPMLTVSKSDAIIQVLPSALRFWDKLGLGPRGGKKNVTAFALFEDDGEEKQYQVERWLGSMSATYAAQHLGTQTAGRSDSCLKDGLVPVKFDSFNKSLSILTASLPTPGSDVVFYLIPPSYLMTATSPALRQLYAAIKRAVISHSEAQIIFQFVPEQLIVDSLENSASRDRDLEILCHSLYERILRPVDRCMSRRFFEHGERVRSYFQDPAFTLARPVLSKVKFLRQTSFQSLDVVDRYTLLHVGYLVSPCGRWILAACVDQRAEAHDFRVWPTQTEAFETHIVTQVWDFALQFARRANVEWRIVFAKLGSMGETELHAWVAHLASAVPTCRELPMIHVSVLSVEQNLPWTFITPQSMSTKPSSIAKCHSSKEMPGAMFVDSSSSTYALFPTHPMPLFPDNQYLRLGGSEPSFISDENDLPLSDTLPVYPLSSTTLIHSPAETGYTSISMLHIHFLHVAKSPNSSLTISDTVTHREITRNYYELAVLGTARWKFHTNVILPLHLGALEVMCSALMKGDLD